MAEIVLDQVSKTYPDGTVAVNTTAEARPAPARRDVVLETAPGALRDGVLAPHAGAITMGLQRSQKG